MGFFRQFAFTFLASSLFMGIPQLGFADVPVNQLSFAEKYGGWKMLFDGKTTKGWRNFRDQRVSEGWSVIDGELRWVKAGAGDIITDKMFENFELSLEYRISKGGNSGIMFHVTEKANRAWKTGPEIQIQDNVGGHDPQLAGWLYDLFKPEKPKWLVGFEKQVGASSPEVIDATRPAGQWNHVYLRVTTKDSEVMVNGISYFLFEKGSDEWNERVAESKFANMPLFGKATKGHICLQDHGNPVAFRNIKVRELNAEGDVSTPQPQLSLKGVLAFNQLHWDQWERIDEQGKLQVLRPIDLTHASDGTNRIFVATQLGRIHVIKNNPATKSTKLFIDLRSRITDYRGGMIDNEEGLLGMAFHPNFKNNGEFFLYYTSSAEPHTSIISRFRVSQEDPNRGDPNSEEILMKIPQPFSNHNGGSIAFGPDGYLYIGLGDGGSARDPEGNGQNLKTLLGSILRIDVNRKEGGRNYAIPADNPFIDRAGARPEIYAYGFRNLWRMGFDRKTGQLWAGDVGQDLWEEVNLVRRGGNYGWKIREGSFPFGNEDFRPVDKPIPPVWEYDHRIGKSITGGLVYRGKRLPELIGHYLYADFVSGRMWALQYNSETGKVDKNYQIWEDGLPVIAFGEDEQGEIYYLVESSIGENIYRLERD